MLEPMIWQMQQRQLKQLEEMNLPNDAYVITEKTILRMNEVLKAELVWIKWKTITSIYTRVCFRKRNWDSCSVF